MTVALFVSSSYRDFRASTGPYAQTSIYWNVLAARLAFIIVFEHVIFFIIYLMQWLVPDVPKKIQDKINHERYIDQRERWASQTNEEKFNHAVTASAAISKMVQRPDENTIYSVNENNKQIYFLSSGEILIRMIPLRFDCRVGDFPFGCRVGDLPFGCCVGDLPFGFRIGDGVLSLGR